MHLLAFFFPPIFGFGFILYFLPGYRCLLAQQAGCTLNSGLKFLPWLDGDWLDYCPGLGAEAGCAGSDSVIA